MANRIKSILKKAPFRPLFLVLRWIFVLLPQKVKLRFHQWKWREKKINCGDKNPDKCFYVIRWDADVNALMGLMNYVLGKIAYAERHGWLPVVDFKNGRNYYFESEAEIGQFNVWEKFFRPITAYSLEEVYQSKYVVLGNISLESDSPNKNMDVLNLGNTYQKWRRLVDQYIAPSEAVKERLEQLNQQYGEPYNKIAIKARGTDYFPPPKGHYVQPGATLLVEGIRELVNRTGCAHAVLATEDETLAEKICGGLESEMDIIRVKCSAVPKSGKVTKIEAGQQYLAELLYLAQAEFLVGGINGGLIGIMLMAKDLRAVKTWLLGKGI